ncbi:MAG: thiamine-phosphate kinase [Candidatus Dadabacteria bacterium]|nr:thiamine-phosphate kinase [Candidatus Dadabacteria bacterium]MYA48990.1 thiamine-phosphate kinase [Candidatus Dadabacteria bacterium]MYG82602.1 thiamine-phosphate kinase [Candidatus Dadabacteria bacterium]MYK49499.1 thiamine-phosphate kinase [Candidatus Dadabacteria bacterium]
MGEEDALRFLADRFKATQKEVLMGIGDDSAVLKLRDKTCLVASTDTLVEGVHFRAETQTPRQLGKKAVCVAVSDIGAMGAVPRYLLCSLGCRGAGAGEFIEELSRGVEDGCREFDVSLVGGNLSESQTVFVSMTALGEVLRNDMVLRSGAAEGDGIYVTGTLGDSALGLRILSSDPEIDGGEVAISRHIEPTPRLAVGRMVAERGIATSMIDISDGLFCDLEKLTSECGLGAEVHLGSLPLSRGFLSLSAKFCEDVYLLAVSGGEDYELLFTSPEDKRLAVDEVSRLCGVAISRIGSVTGGRGVRFFDEGGEEVFYDTGGFEHFR